MVERKIEIYKQITLILSEPEARWLKALVQNPIGYDDPADESVEAGEMRAGFWDGLKDIDL